MVRDGCACHTVLGRPSETSIRCIAICPNPPTLEKNECDVVGLLANFVIHILIDDCFAYSLSD